MMFSSWFSSSGQPADKRRKRSNDEDATEVSIRNVDGTAAAKEPNGIFFCNGNLHVHGVLSHTVDGQGRHVVHHGSGDLAIDNGVRDLSNHAHGVIHVKGDAWKVINLGTGDIVVDGTAKEVLVLGNGNVTVKGNITGNVLISGAGRVYHHGNLMGKVKKGFGKGKVIPVKPRPSN